MPELRFEYLGAVPEAYTATPTMRLDVAVEETTGARVHAMVLRCQIRIEPLRRHYAPDEEEGLRDLFGGRERWGETLKPIQFATVPLMLPGFSGATTFGVPVPCSYDTEVAAAKYFRALGDGEIPLLLLFSGTVFYAGGEGLHVEPVPWDRELSVRVPVAVWRDVMAAHFPGTGWIRLHHDTLDDLHRYRSARMLPSWEDTFAALLKEAGQQP